MKLHPILLCLSLSLPWLVLADPAQPLAPQYHTQAVVTDQAFGQAAGVVGLNMAAGDYNLQLNARALALATGNGIAASQLNSVQSLNNNFATAPDIAISRIDSDAFANASGIIGVNQASGVLNMQMNGVAIGLGLGGGAVAESVLAATSGGSSVGSSAPLPNQQRAASITGNAFSGAKGIVQINQLAGSKNVTSNHFALGVSLGAD